MLFHCAVTACTLKYITVLGVRSWWEFGGIYFPRQNGARNTYTNVMKLLFDGRCNYFLGVAQWIHL